jgi:Arc/MetJ-type ribon-helix-helix transcriptional regulator
LYYELDVALTVRLSPKDERTLNALAKRRRLSRSEIVRDAIVQYDEDRRGDEVRERPYDAWVDVIGVVSLGVRRPDRTTGEQFLASLQARARARRAR